MRLSASAPSGSPSLPPPGRSRTPSARKLQDYVARSSARASDRQAGAVARQGAGEDAAHRGGAGGSQPVLRLPKSDRAAPAADHARHGGGRLWRDSRSCSASTCASIRTIASRCSASNGNGKTTLARLLAAQLPAMEGDDERLGQDDRSAISPSIRSRNSTSTDTPLEHMTAPDEGRHAGCGAGAARAFRLLRRSAPRRGRIIVGRRARTPRARAHHPQRAAPADPRRADQPSRRRFARGAGPGAQRLFRRRWCSSATIAT